MNIAGRILKMFGWKVTLSVPDHSRCLICVAPHTSNWDFIIGKLAYASVGRKAGFLMKSSWFFWPLGYFFRAIGGIPVYRKNKKVSLTDQLVERFNTEKRLVLAITPEGTRSRTAAWHTGFLQIAYRAQIPIVLGAIDFKTKDVILEKSFTPTGDMESDMKAIKEYYKGFTGKHPDKFTTE